MIERGHTLKDQRTYSRAPGVMPQRGAHENGRRLRKKPLQKAVSEAEAEANPSKASWLLKEPAEKLAGCAKQRQQFSNCRSIEKHFQILLNEDAMPASSLAGLGTAISSQADPAAPRNRGRTSQTAQSRACAHQPEKAIPKNTSRCAVTKRTLAPRKYHAPRNEYPYVCKEKDGTAEKHMLLLTLNSCGRKAIANSSATKTDSAARRHKCLARAN